MISLGKRATGLRLERMQASPLWTEAGFRNQYPIPRGLRDTTAAPHAARVYFLRRPARAERAASHRGPA